MNAAAALLLALLFLSNSAAGADVQRENSCYNFTGPGYVSSIEEEMPEYQDTGGGTVPSAFARIHFHSPFLDHHISCAFSNTGTHQANRLFIVLKTIRR
ncbi:MAG: hypothetical protein U1E11_09185 [Dethiobacteria bacterium]|nr:hypothetical protein [Dethiobacteria bacterium]